MNTHSRRNSSTRGFAPRSSDDLYLVYTGGTTGMPKGVLWRHEDFYHNVICLNQATSKPRVNPATRQ